MWTKTILAIYSYRYCELELHWTTLRTYLIHTLLTLNGWAIEWYTSLLKNLLTLNFSALSNHLSQKQHEFFLYFICVLLAAVVVSIFNTISRHCNNLKLNEIWNTLPISMQRHTLSAHSAQTHSSHFYNRFRHNKQFVDSNMCHRSELIKRMSNDYMNTVCVILYVPLIIGLNATRITRLNVNSQ